MAERRGRVEGLSRYIRGGSIMCLYDSYSHVLYIHEARHSVSNLTFRYSDFEFLQSL